MPQSTALQHCWNRHPLATDLDTVMLVVGCLDLSEDYQIVVS